MGDEKRIDEVAGEIIARDSAKSKGRPGKGLAAAVPRRRALVAAGAAVVVAAVGVGAVLAGRDEADPASQSAGSLSSVSSSSSSTSTSTTSSTSTSTSAPPQLVSGTYSGSVEVDEDPAGHSCCVFPAASWGVLQTRDSNTRVITIALSDVVEGIDLSSPLGDTGDPFRAVGVGTVAGFGGTEVAFDGTVTPEAGLHGTLTVGGNGTLPTGQPITFTVDMTKDA